MRTESVSKTKQISELGSIVSESFHLPFSPEKWRYTEMKVKYFNLRMNKLSPDTKSKIINKITTIIID